MELPALFLDKCCRIAIDVILSAVAWTNRAVGPPIVREHIPEEDANLPKQGQSAHEVSVSDPMPLGSCSRVLAQEKRATGRGLLGAQRGGRGTGDTHGPPETSSAFAGRAPRFLLSLCSHGRFRCALVPSGCYYGTVRHGPSKPGASVLWHEAFYLFRSTEAWNHDSFLPPAAHPFLLRR